MAALTLVKICLLLDLENLQAAVQKAGRDKMTIEQNLGFLQEEALSDILLSRSDIVGKDDFGDLVAELRRQSLGMYKVVKEYNRYFWPAILEPEKYGNAIPGAYSWRSEEKTVLAFRES
ncbi:hypothetical protein NKR19_g6466 [Coniochaeta hoffmannii]|uniref:Uncharacterized protein n=1 Tax=Coniochaeta hoffmannii TaxID=91930 RepID=A0AA38VPX1_9PEZI|nr:hypothetical protein NKR19_g6466 [Coniochaeta hoffmannii]